MKLSQYLLILATSAKLAVSHATVHAAWINNVDQGAGNSPSGYIRSPPNNSPLTDVNTQDLFCNVNGRTAVQKTLSVKSGDKFAFEWHHQDRSAGDDIIAESHKGPVMVYMSRADGTTNNWVKIAEEGYNPNTKQWAVDRLRANRGLHSITIPNVQPGKYLLRAEIIALHEAFRDGGAQFYMECVQVQVTSSGGVALPNGVSMPGTYKADHPGIKFDLYNGFSSYSIPGPAVWTAGGAGTPAPTTKPITTTSFVTRTTTKPAGSQPTANIYDQCDGINYTGPKQCAAGTTCKYQNPYYSQCLP